MKKSKIRRTKGYTNVQLIVILLIALSLNLFSMLMLVDTGELLEAMSIIHIAIGAITSFLAIDLKEELWDSDEDKIFFEAFLTGIILAFPLSLFLPYFWNRMKKLGDLINKL